MPKPVRRLLQIFSVLVVLVLSWFGWQLYRINGATESMVWQIEEGGLTLTYFPLKDHATLFVSDDYVRGSDRTWRMTEPGASNRIVGAIPVPSPERLFSDAYVYPVHKSIDADCGPDARYGLKCSSGTGVVNLYSDVSDLQRSNIIWNLEYACERDAAYCVFLSQVRDLAEEP